MKHRTSSVPAAVARAVFFTVLGVGIFLFVLQRHNASRVVIPNEPTIASSPTPQRPEPAKPPSAPLPEPKPIKENQYYYTYTVKTQDGTTELTALVGADHIAAVLQTNRIDLEHITPGMDIVVPKVFDLSSRSPFPNELDIATDIAKLLIFDQTIQAFGAYESGKLVRWGPTSTGKQSTPTPNGLFSTNWKGKEVKSSFDDEWILHYNFNIDNAHGIGFHQYSMPGYPASHSCIRLLLDDAMWLYEWADQWILNSNEQKRLAHGTPVLIFGEYRFDETAPWKRLPQDPNATTIDGAELSSAVASHKDTILLWQAERTNLRAAEDI